MKYSTLFFIATILVFTNCKKDKQTKQTFCTQLVDYKSLDYHEIDSECTTDLCIEYLTIWKELLKEKNNLSQDFIDKHIELYNTEIHTWEKGFSFRVGYKFKIGWAVAYNSDQFIIKINTDNTYYPSLDLPRGTYLAKEEIKIAADNRAFSSDIGKIANVDNIIYSTVDNALSDLIEFSGVNQLCINQITLNEDNGNLILSAYAQYENKENSCIEGTIDLITGTKNVNDTPCWIY
jgi:hypothetical protein